MKKEIIFFLILSFFSINSYSQTYCPDLGPDQYLPCNITSTTLTADLSNCGGPGNNPPRETTTYLVESIPFTPYPVAGNTVTLGDDVVSGALPIGFSFCFFGNTYTQFYIGSNGWISFSPGQPTTFTSASIPSGAANIPKNCIMGPWQDWHPGIAGGPYIRYQTIGTAPCRKLVVSFTNIPFFSCTTTTGTFQIVLNEATNIIENHITSKPNCLAWAGGTAVQGIHNQAGTVAFTVPGRNSTQWTAFNDSWQYTPNGPIVPGTLVWYQVGNPVPIATGVNSIVVTPPPGGAEYTAHFTYTGCNTGYGTCVPLLGVPGPDTVLVVPGINTTAATSIINNENCYNACDGDAIVNPISGTPPFTYLWLPGGQTTQFVSGLCQGNYIVTVTDADGCDVIINVNVGGPITPPIIGSSISHN